VTSSGTLTGALASETANTFFAAPNGVAGVPTFRGITAADVPTLNQNTTGSSASFTGALAGDVTGTQSAAVVGKINGTSMAGLGTGILKNTTGTGVPSIAVAADFPTLNQNTTGTASNVTGIVAVGNGGSGQTTAQAALNTFAGGVTAGQYLRGNGTNVLLSAIQASDVPTLNQSTTGSSGSVANALTMNNGGAGAASGTTYNGSAAQTISYNTIGAPSTTGTGASGTWGINVTGSSATSTTATTATNVGGGAVNEIVFQTGAGATSFAAAPSTASTFLEWNGSAFVWSAVSGAGTVTSVGLSLPSDYTVSGSPVTSSGTLTAVRASQSANLFLASPNGASGAPTYRSIVAADVPTLNQNTTGTSGGLAGTALTGDVTNSGNTVSLNLGTAHNWSNTQTYSGSSSVKAAQLVNASESVDVVAAAPSATQTFYLASGAVQYYTTNAANNWTINWAWSSGTSMNTAMAVGDSVTTVMLTTQGTTAYYASAFQVDGTSVTPKWQGGTAPAAGNASGIDAYTCTIIKTASATYTVLCAQTQYK
jgi:hypothetical protein